jgi:hypothetical protein
MTESQQPNPFSREGSSPSDGLGSDSAPDAETPTHYPSGGSTGEYDESTDSYTNDWPSYPAEEPYGTPAFDPYGRPVGGSSSNATYTGPGLASQPMPSYDDPHERYGESFYSNPYETNPYQPSFGGVTPYGTAATTPAAVPHPQATLALALGIIGTVLGLFCVVPGLIGIGGIVLGRRVKNDIDADPGRYTGRSQAVAGLITGIIGVSICVLATVFIVVAITIGIASTGF